MYAAEMRLDTAKTKHQNEHCQYFLWENVAGKQQSKNARVYNRHNMNGGERQNSLNSTK